jgi:hypothetical protein
MDMKEMIEANAKLNLKTTMNMTMKVRMMRQMGMR